MKLLFRALEKAGTLNLHTIFLLQYPFGKIPGNVCCKPVDHVLVWTVEVYIGNAYELHSRLGKNTDKQDTAWIAELLAHGLIWSSFVTPPDICALRDVTRTRVALCRHGAKVSTWCTSSSRIPISHLVAWSPISLGAPAGICWRHWSRGERDPQV